MELKVARILEEGDSAEKIRALEELECVESGEILKKIVARLDDEDRSVRGEAFSALVLNKNRISDVLMRCLDSPSKNIRGFLLLVLANRGETSAIPEMERLAGDESSMVRACAVGALGHLGARDSGDVFLRAVRDENIEVRKSALYAIANLEIPASREEIGRTAADDEEARKLVLRITDV